MMKELLEVKLNEEVLKLKKDNYGTLIVEGSDPGAIGISRKVLEDNKLAKFLEAHLHD